MKKLALILLACLLASVPLAAQETGLSPEGRMAVFSGIITNIDPQKMTIKYMGDDITIKAGQLTQGGGRLRDYYSEGMLVTVEGILEGKNEVVATRITRGAYYDYMPYLSD